MNTCSQCKWWKRDLVRPYIQISQDGNIKHDDVEWTGQCKRHSPIRTGYISAEWPVTSEKDWCGEWEASDRMNETERKLKEAYDKTYQAAMSGEFLNIPKP